MLLLLLLALPARAQAPLVFVDDETTVRRISFKFVDTQTFEESRLEAQIATREPGFWDQVGRLLPFIGEAEYPFSPVELQKDVVRLRRYYERNGFLHPTIDYPASQLDTSKNAIHVVFTVREGPPLIIQDVGFFTPDSVYVFEELGEALRDSWIRFRDATTVEVGSRYTEFDRFRIQSAVQTWLRDEGFAFAQVDSRVAIDSTANTADIRFVVTPGPRAYVEEIVVEGNETVEDQVVRRELPFQVGDRFSHRKMIQGQRELFNLNLFRVALADVPEQPVDSSVVVRYRVREADLRYMSAQTGYAADNGVTLQGEWRHRNFMGGARQFDITSVLRSGYGATLPTGFESGRQVNVTLSLRQPYLFTTHLSGIVSPFYNWQDDPIQQISFNEVGVNTTLIYELLPFRPLTLRHTFSRSYGDTQGLLQRLDPTDTRRFDIYDRSIFSLSATLGDVDDFIVPKRGFIVRPFAEAAGGPIGSSVEYLKASGEVVGYRPLGRGLNLSGRLFVGGIQPLGPSKRQNEDPLIEARFDRIRFYAGGGNDVRGWSANLLGPLRVDTVFTSEGEVSWADSAAGIPNVRYEPDGGLSKLAANVELRLPFPMLGDAWSTALFIDAGQVYPQLRADPKGLQFGVGGGIRYETVVGFIRLDLGYKVNPRDTDLFSAEEKWKLDHGLVERGDLNPSLWDRFRLHLSIGQAF